MNINELSDNDKIKYLQDFEEEIAEIYETGVIHGPIHLRGGNESQLIDIFKDINYNDIVFSTWSNHLPALLHQIPKEKIKERILSGHSMAMNFPPRFYTSSIVGGICSIATGTAWAIKNKKEDKKIIVLIGDMTAFTGITNECIRYSINWDLPVLWIVEDNNLSVNTPTDIIWNESTINLYFNWKEKIEKRNCKFCKIKFYSYKNKWPHSATGEFISF